MTTQIQENMPMIGVEDLHFAKPIDGGGYDTPVLFPRVKQIGLKNKVQSLKLYGDNRLFYKVNDVDCVDVTITTNDLTDDEEAYLLGHTLDPNGGIIYKSTDHAQVVCMLFRAIKANGEYRHMILYGGQFEPYDDDIKGQEGKSTPSYKKLKGTFMPLENGLYKHKFDTDSPNITQEKIDNFFKKVYIPGEESKNKVSK